MHVTFLFAFSSRYAKTRTSNFCKVVWQHTESVESIIWILLEIYLSFQQWKNFENPLRINKVIAMSLLYYFLGDTMWCHLNLLFHNHALLACNCVQRVRMAFGDSCACELIVDSAFCTRTSLVFIKVPLTMGTFTYRCFPSVHKLPDWFLNLYLLL